MKKVLLTTLAVLFLTACTQKTSSSTDLTTTSSQPDVTMTTITTPDVTLPLTFKLDALNGSKQDGVVTFKDVNGRIVVTLSLNSPVSASEPAHIHVGSCPAPGDVKYTLTSVVNGKSETTLPESATLSSLKDMGGLSVNVHKSTSELKTNVSCGNLDWSTATKGESIIPDASAATSGALKP